MGNSFGKQTLPFQVGNDLQVLANLDHARWKPGGITVNWALFPAVAGADVVLPDGNKVVIGQKAIRYGQILVQPQNGTAQTVAITGSPTGGSFTLGVNTLDGTGVQTTGPIAYNATANAVQAALQALPNVGADGVVVTGTNPNFTATFRGPLGSTIVPQMAATGSFTGGSSPAVAATVTNPGSATSDLWGPYDVNATDGRQTLTRGLAFILNQTAYENSVLVGLPTPATNHPPGLFYAGLCHRDRLLMGDFAINELGGPNGPSQSVFEAAFSGINYALL